MNARAELGLTALHVAAQYGRLDMVRYLVKKGASFSARDNHGGTALHYAAEGHLDVVRYLVENGADVHARDTIFGSTALHVAAFYGHLAVVKYLVGQGADAHARASNFVTPRDAAVACSTDTRRSDATRADCSAVVAYFDSL